MAATSVVVALESVSTPPSATGIFGGENATGSWSSARWSLATGALAPSGGTVPGGIPAYRWSRPAIRW